MKRKQYLVRLAGFLGLVGWMLAVSPKAEAHYLWVETVEQKDKNNTVRLDVYYGEFEESLRETAGGRLDEVTTIEANPHAKFDKKEDHFETFIPLNLLPDSAIVQIQELDRPVKDWTKYDIGVVKPNYYVSAYYPVSRKNTLELKVPEHKMTLGIYPISLGKEIVVKVFFKGEVLPGAKVNVHAPNGWSKEFKTDPSGMARFSLPWTGQYVLEVIHAEKTPGQFKGATYEAIRHRATFTRTHEAN